MTLLIAHCTRKGSSSPMVRFYFGSYGMPQTKCSVRMHKSASLYKYCIK